MLIFGVDSPNLEYYPKMSSISESGIKSWEMLRNALIKAFKAEVNDARMHK